MKIITVFNGNNNYSNKIYKLKKIKKIKQHQIKYRAILIKIIIIVLYNNNKLFKIILLY